MHTLLLNKKIIDTILQVTVRELYVTIYIGVAIIK